MSEFYNHSFLSADTVLENMDPELLFINKQYIELTAKVFSCSTVTIYTCFPVKTVKQGEGKRHFGSTF